MHALWHYRHHVSHIPSLDIESALDQAQAYLLNQLAQGENETFETALALIAILPRLTNRDEISGTIDALRAAQLDNGSWDNDVYTTALALRALHIADNPPDLGKLHGIVMDSSNNAPLPNVAIVATFGDSPIHLTTNASGTFELEGLRALEGELSFTLEGYVSLSYPLVMEPGEILDLGIVHLQKVGEPLLLDLVVEDVDPYMPLDPQTLILSGQITTEIKNAGTVPTSQNINLLAFYDANRDGVYQTDSEEILLGEAVITRNLAVDETLPVAIPVAGQLPFRDAPITVMVDSRQIITEIEEENNVGATSKVCQVVPHIGSFEPVIKWETTLETGGTDVSHTPIVGPLQDTNGDGLINQHDTPAVIVLYGYSSGPMVALDGKTGQELWRTETSFETYGVTPALGDIDADGQPEIVTVFDRYRHLIAIDHNGQEKWISQEPFTGISNHMGITLADLDGDGQGEIMVGNTVYNSTGELKWRGSYYDYSYQKTRDIVADRVSIVADLDLEGSLDVIMGAYVCQAADGSCQRKLPSLSGFSATGNFDSDPYPEIVVRETYYYWNAYYKLSQFEHNGLLKWGPVYPVGPVYPRGDGGGGSITIADLDGDGNLDIGIAGQQYYQVFDHNGGPKWHVSISDYNTGANGSSVFDFDGDGQVEVVYQDGPNLYIFNGSNGEVRFTTPNSSATWIEYPSIADVDNDGHADIIVANSQGVRVFQDANNTWMPARGIWNQHAYHITNINDDGSLPRVQQNPTTFHQQQQLEIPDNSDITAGRLLIIDNGAGQPITLQARIGNAGLAPSTANLPLTFYAGDPANNGTELGTVMLDTLAPGTYQDVQLPGVFLSDFNQDIYAVVDAQNTLEECNENNNSVWTSVKEATLTHHGKISLTTDAPTYGPNTPVLIDYTITNLGALPADFKVALRLETVNNAILKTFSTKTAPSLAGGDSQSFQATWNTGTTLAGPYQVHALVETEQGEPVTEAIHPFTITAATEGPVVTLRTTTDKPTYHTNDVVLINHLLNNASLNTLIEDALLTLTIKGPDGELFHTESQALNSLSPQGLQEINTPIKLREIEKGTYTVTVTLNGHDDSLLITQTTRFKVENDLKFSIAGQVQIDSAQLTQGQTQRCTATVTNQGTDIVRDLAVQYLLINLDTQASVNTQTATIDLASGGEHTQTVSYDTLSFPITHYACVVQAQLGEDWQTLDFKTFNLHGILSTECSTVYAIHDQDRSDTQLFTYDLNNNTIKPLGPLYPERDLEGLDIHPHTHLLYASTGQPRSRLEQVNAYNGDLTPIGYIGFKHVTSLSFHPLGQLWGGAQGGLIQIDTDTGQGHLKKPHNLKMEGISWNNKGTLLYATAVTPPNPHSSLWVYDPETSELSKHCDNLSGEIESLETLPDDRLAFGIHDDQALSFHVYDPEQCQTVQGSRIQTPYNDIEAIAWPSANCTFMQKALQAFFIALSGNEDIYLGEDRNLRVSLDGQIYKGQLALEKTQGLLSSDGQLHLIAIPDANQDGIDDFLITYPNGQQQILYFQGLTSN